MPTLTTQYVYFGASGDHTRQPRATTSYGGFLPIPGLNPSGTSTLVTGSPFQSNPVEPTQVAGGVTYEFAFTSVTGCVEGGRVSYVCSTPTPAGTVGSSPIVVLVVYVPTGGGPGTGDTGAVIDAFNETTGSLVDNNFVTVSPDSVGNPVTYNANVNGWVDTEDTAYTITADHPNIGPYLALPTSALFDQWVVLTNPSPPMGLVSGANLTPGVGGANVAKGGGTVYALAFYRNPPAVKLSKEYHPDKNLKEYIKELEKLHKEQILEVPNKSIVSEGPIKGVKENVELPGFGPPGDPGEFTGAINNLNQRVANLEAAQRAAAKGKAFIKAEDRPPVGTTKARKLK
jgi:hypothetical protein